jgi:nitric oxide reductase NorQ protein
MDLKGEGVNMQKIANNVSVGPYEEFVETAAVKSIFERALLYLQTGLPVHLAGPTGTGKSALAMHLADALHQPVMLIFGDDEYTTANLIGDRIGYHKRKLVDNFIHSVLKTEEDVSERWVDNRLTTACKEGLTLIYDEFNRSRPEANNVLLSVLEEGILTLPTTEVEPGYIKVHPNFRAIFTSNPKEYTGVHKTQDSLFDRMVTIHLDYFDEETERAIVVARAGVPQDAAAKIVGLLQDFRQEAGSHRTSSLRPAITLGKLLVQNGVQADKHNSLFVDICVDTLLSARHNSEDCKQMTEIVTSLIKKHF